MEQLLATYKPDFDKSLSLLSQELATLRIGRANPIIVEHVGVEAYGVKTPLKQLASIAVPEARTLVITPWDKSIIKDIEKAIVLANIGINPVNEGSQLRLTVPALTEESRKELVRSVNEKMEKTRIAMRQLRDKVKDDITSQEKNGQLTQDDRYDLQKKLDDLVKDYNDQIKMLGEKKKKRL